MAFAGFDTITSALARCVYLLAQHPHTQARLRSEIRDAINFSVNQNITSELSYDVLMNLPFLDSVVKETLCLYSSFPLMSRTYVPLSTRLLSLYASARSRSGVYTSSAAVPQGTFIVISILAANRHREMWGADANEWRPERWLSSPLAAHPSQAQAVSAPFTGENAAPSSRQPAPVLGVKDGVRFLGVYSNM
ncbi:cytochrome P450 [Suillus lakei]|nr:cytochrome P450 [Suillus lakei]